MQQLITDSLVFILVLGTVALSIASMGYIVSALIKKCRRSLYSRRRRPTIEQATELARFSIPTYSRSRMCDHEEE